MSETEFAARFQRFLFCGDCGVFVMIVRKRRTKQPVEKPALAWEFFRDEGTWESFSAYHDQGNPFRWVIKVQQDGKFDLSDSASELVNGVAAFDTLSAAKSFCESSEAVSLAIGTEQ